MAGNKFWNETKPCIMLVICVLIAMLENCDGHFSSNSSSSVINANEKSYIGYEVVRVFAADSDELRSINMNILNVFDYDLWSQSYVSKNGTGNYIDIMVSPSDKHKLYAALKTNMIGSNILHHNVHTLIVQEANLVSNTFTTTDEGKNLQYFVIAIGK